MPTEKIQAYFENPELSAEEIKSLINSMDHFEIARRLHELPVETKIRIFHFLDSDQKRMELLYETDKHSRLEIQDSLDVDDLARLLQGIPEDEATDIIMEHPDETRDEILEKMSPQEGETIKNLITYGEQTAGGLMVRHYNKVRENEAAAEILLKLKRDRNQDSPPYFYVVNEKNQLLGYFNLRQLLNVPANARPLEFISQDTPKVLYSDSCEKVANLMDHEHLSVIPVVNEDNVMQGIVTFDDVIRAMQDIASEDIFTMVGTDTVDPFARKTVQKITSRAPWLFPTFVGGLISALILGSYQNVLPEFAAVILFIPFVIGLSGNIAIQGATVIVRGLATGDIQLDNIKTVVKSELLVGLSNGLIFGVLCGFILTLIARPIIQTNPILGFTVAAGIMMAVGASSLIGSITPILFLKWGIDPAISTGPFVIVINDILGLALYLATAGIIYSWV